MTKKELGFCLNGCGKHVSRPTSVFCGTGCYQIYRHKEGWFKRHPNLIKQGRGSLTRWAKNKNRRPILNDVEWFNTQKFLQTKGVVDYD
jgi:hypothetical protein